MSVLRLNIWGFLPLHSSYVLVLGWWDTLSSLGSFWKLPYHSIESGLWIPALRYLPLHLLLVLVFPCLRLHLLNLNGVRLPPTHVQLMIPHAQGQDPLINPKTRSIEHKVLEGKKSSWVFQGWQKGSRMPLSTQCMHAHTRNGVPNFKIFTVWRKWPSGFCKAKPQSTGPIV